MKQEVIVRPYDDGNGGLYELQDYWTGRTIKTGFKAVVDAEDWASFHNCEIIVDNFYEVRLGNTEK